MIIKLYGGPLHGGTLDVEKPPDRIEAPLASLEDITTFMDIDEAPEITPTKCAVYTRLVDQRFVEQGFIGYEFSRLEGV